jgi:hypothetical protein
MVEAKLTGKSTSAIAQAEGLSRDWAARELESPESRQIIAALVDRSFERVQKLYFRILDVIEEAAKADRVVNSPLGILNLGADHYARLTAAKRYIELVTAGRPTPRAPYEAREKRTITLQELERLVTDAKNGGLVQ